VFGVQLAGSSIPHFLKNAPDGRFAFENQPRAGTAEMMPVFLPVGCPNPGALRQ
jgi:hypothetical protein